MRATTLAAGGLACAGAAMTIAAFAGGGSAQDAPPAAAPTTQAATVAKDGLHVWIANGCGGCHTFQAANSNAPIGPDLGQSLKGKDRDYVMRAIVLPNADVATNFTPGGMPEDFAERIAPDGLNRLVDFIVAGVASGG